MTRIKYIKECNSLLTDWFTVGPNFVIRGVINTESNTFLVYDINDDEISRGQGKDLRQAKDMLKKALIKAGVNFSGEIRNRV